MNIPKELKYTKDHEWVKIEGDLATVGITDYAQSQIGDVVFVELPQEGDMVTAHDSFAVVESVKAVSDIYAPVSGEIYKINVPLPDEPEIVNSDPYGAAWFAVIKMSHSGEAAKLLDAAGYQKIVDEGENDA